MSNVELLTRLRNTTKAGMADCRQALTESDNDFEKATEWLRKKGILKGTKLQEKEATEGAIYSYIHQGGKIGVLLEVNCQTDFVAHTDEFKAFCRDVALHIVGRDPYPLYVSVDNIPADVLGKEYAFFFEKAKETGKAEKMLHKIVEGQLAKWSKDICLLNQEFVKEPTKTINDLMLELSGKTGEKITIKRFTRYALGEK